MRNMNAPNTVGSDKGIFSASTWAGWLGVLAGIWLVAAPFVFNYADTTPTTNDIAVGLALLVLAGFCVFTVAQASMEIARQVAGGLAVIAGVWLIVAPFVLNYSGIAQAIWNDIIAGVLSVIVAGYGVATARTSYNNTFAG